MFRSMVAAVMVFGLGSAAFANDDQYYQIKNYSVKDVTADYPQTQVMAQPGLAESCESGVPVNPKLSDGTDLGGALGGVEVIVDQIINIGKKIFAVIAAGRPVVNMKIDTANALPKGLTCWSDLAGWSIPQTKVYKVTYYNGYGMAVVDFNYRLTFTAGGSANGFGKYITNATFMPAELSVGWGFTFDANASIPSVLNTGTHQEPVAGMQMNMDWKVTSPVSYRQATESYFVSGANTLTELH